MFAQMAQTQRMPLLDNTKFSELFTLTDKKRVFVTSFKHHISTFMCGSIDDKRKSFNVIPSSAVLDAIEKTMLVIDYDEIYFDFISLPEWDYVTVYAKYNQILGSRLIAIVDKQSFIEA